MRKMIRHAVTAAAVGAIALAAPVAAAAPDVKTGVDAWMNKDFTSAVRTWRPLADKGDADAQFNMGQAYKLGRGVPTDMKIARSWYEKAAQQGHDKAQANLGLLMFQGGERAQAMPWIRKAAERGDARAQYVLATAMFNGDYATKDWPTAYGMMTRAAAQGLPQAANSLTQMDKYLPRDDREKGIAVARRLEQAQKTASAGSVVADLPTSAALQAPPAATKTTTATKAAAPVARPSPPAPSLASAGGRWRVQLGAYGSQAGARTEWSKLSARISGLAGLQPSFEAAGNLTRLRVGPLASRAAADRVCASAKAAGQACFAIAP